MSLALSDIAPIRRAGQPIDIAEAVLWLASDAASFVNGQAIAVDGGLLTGSLRRNRPASNADILALLRQAAEEAGA
jgi:NAD(P)-dependent dehydrogenase (short-subunit alcohol dehydrogenase family)